MIYVMCIICYWHNGITYRKQRIMVIGRSANVGTRYIYVVITSYVPVVLSYT